MIQHKSSGSDDEFEPDFEPGFETDFDDDEDQAEESGGMTLDQALQQMKPEQRFVAYVSAVMGSRLTKAIVVSIAGKPGVRIAFDYVTDVPGYRWQDSLYYLCNIGLLDRKFAIRSVFVAALWVKVHAEGGLQPLLDAVNEVDRTGRGKNLAYGRMRRHVLRAWFTRDVNLLHTVMPELLMDPYAAILLGTLDYHMTDKIRPDTMFGTLWCAIREIVLNRMANCLDPAHYHAIANADVAADDILVPAAMCECAFYRADRIALERLDLAYGSRLPARALLLLLDRRYEDADDTYCQWLTEHAAACMGLCAGVLLNSLITAAAGNPSRPVNIAPEDWGFNGLMPHDVFAKVVHHAGTGGLGEHIEEGHDAIPASQLAIGLGIGSGHLAEYGYEDIHKLYDMNVDGPLRWWTAELYAAQSQGKKKKNAPPDHIRDLLDKNGRGPVTGAPWSGAQWKSQLNAIQSLLETKTKPPMSPLGDRRIVWLIGETRGKIPSITPREQSLGKNGNWTKGRSLTLADFVLTEHKSLPPSANENDRAVAAGISEIGQFRHASYYRSTPYYTIDPPVFFKALAAHPLVFHDGDTDTLVTVVLQEPRVVIARTDKGFTVELVPAPVDKSGALYNWESKSRFVVTIFTAEHQKLGEILQAQKLFVPDAGRDMLAAIQSQAETVFQLESDLTGSAVETAEPADPTILILVEPEHAGLRFQVRVDPTRTGEYLAPGSGTARLSRLEEDRIVRVERNLAAERQTAEDAVFRAVGTGPGEDWTWLYAEPAEALTALAGFHDLTEGSPQIASPRVKLVWPRGKPTSVSRQVDTPSLSVKMMDDDDWFACSGSLQVSQDLTVGLGDLLRLMGGRIGSFVELSEGHYLRLSDRLRRQLEQMSRAHTGKSKGDSVRFHSILAVDNDWLDTLGGFKPSPRWQAVRRQLADWQTPEVPVTLQAELRPYQIDGFQWLAQRTALGFGACLADDMGLGKTLQAIAVALLHAQDGPTLVIAPTSVCANWLAEIRRFAPSLNPLSLSAVPDRDLAVAAAGPFDICICSYGLLQTTESITEREWQLIVLDEAQAIKNPGTQRAKSVCALNGKARIATTGTPVENHVGELWSLFRFLNPGLLGSLSAFRSQYGDLLTNPDQARHLQQVTRPFILRRTKSQVLDDLPARTEINLEVELSAREIALYESIRRNALERISDADVQEQKGRFTVLAEIMRLRRACCHPKLIDPSLTLPGAKLELLLEVVDELRENRHQALIFSQFVDHLTVIREALDARGITYQYLDGSTPAPQREKAVKAFQAGQGDFFLISLKAGGTGINLTAADYVIHMDPWWNPAVEDQASDRAHRIGQTRPVTVYRLVAKGTIEEKILELHARKRKIADQIISETDGPVSLDDLKDMLAQGFGN